MTLENNIKEDWYDLAKASPATTLVKEEIISNVIKKYSSNSRHYHNLNHIKTLLDFSKEYAYLAKDLEVIQLSIFFHDVVYDATSSANEEKSAEQTKEAMATLMYSEDKINKVYRYILATKSHINYPAGLDSDLDLFLDFDLLILAAPKEQYLQYTQQIRKEYSLIPSLIYNPGRKKVLKSFLEASAIYKSRYFKENFEDTARENVGYEIGLL